MKHGGTTGKGPLQVTQIEMTTTTKIFFSRWRLPPQPKVIMRGAAISRLATVALTPIPTRSASSCPPPGRWHDWG